jgi:hypothetical protein
MLLFQFSCENLFFVRVNSFFEVDATILYSLTDPQVCGSSLSTIRYSSCA